MSSPLLLLLLIALVVAIFIIGYDAGRSAARRDQ